MNPTSPENIAHVERIARRFLADTYQWTPPDADSWRRAIQQVLSELERALGPGVSLETVNRRAISQLKSMALAGSMEQELTAVSAEAQVASPYDRGESDRPDESPEAFMDKVQALENLRKAPIIAPPAAAAAPALTPAPAALMQPVAAAVPTAPTTQIIYNAPAPTKRAIPIRIHGHQRDIHAFPERSAFQWLGTVPAFADSASMRLTAVWLPRMCAEALQSPYYVVVVQGAGADSCSMVVAEARGVSLTAGAAWRMYVPVSETQAVMPCLATPWRIELRDAEDCLVALGADKLTVSYSTIVSSDSTAIYLTPDAAGGAPASPLPQPGELIKCVVAAGAAGAPGENYTVLSSSHYDPRAAVANQPTIYIRGAHKIPSGATLIVATRQIAALFEATQAPAFPARAPMSSQPP